MYLEGFYNFFDHPAGRLLIAQVKQGIGFSALGNSDQELLVELELYRLHTQCCSLFVPNASDVINHAWENLQLNNLSQIKLEMVGTPLQIAVWKYLSEIPVGQVKTYSQIASAIGKPDAVRAVASACGKNHLALFVPCHRAVRKDGVMTGFRWGVERKKLLLALDSGTVI